MVKAATPCPALRAEEEQGVQGPRGAVREADGEAAAHRPAAGPGTPDFEDSGAWAARGPLP